MLVVEVDVVGAEALERALACALDVVGTAVQPAGAVRIVGVEAEAELGRDLHLVAVPGDRPAHQPLVRVRPVYLGRVQESHAQLERAIDGLEP